MNALQYISSNLYNRKVNSTDKNPPSQNLNVQISLDIVTDNDNDPIYDKNSQNLASEAIDESLYLNHLINIIIFVPKFLIYFPVYYILLVILYPFKLIYMSISYIITLVISIFSPSKDIIESSTIDDIDKSDFNINDSNLSTPNNDYKQGKQEKMDITDGNLQNQEENNKNNEISKNKPQVSKYTPKYSISTIMEESMEFDPEYHENDDYFKSPSDSNPVIPSNCLSDFKTKNTDENRNNDNFIPLHQKSESHKVSSINDKLLALADSSALSSAQPLNTDKENRSSNKNILIDNKSIDTNKKELETPTKRRKKKKFIFPKLLFNFNIFEPPKLPKKILVLDLDETLIHSLSRFNSSMLNKTKGVSIEVKVKGSLPTLYHIYKRPYVEEFLAIVYQWFDLVCFTASIKEYADPVINYLEQQVLLNDIMKKSMKKLQNELPSKIFKERYYRNSCIFLEGKGYLKDLSVLLNNNSLNDESKKITPKSKVRSRASSISSNVSKTNLSKPLDYSKIVIIDNSPISYVRHKDNGLMIEGWINDPDDSELMNLLPLLNSLRFVSDVRCIIGLKNGQRAFN